MNALVGLTASDWEELKRKREKIIYLLTDPRPDRIYCYVGQTNNIQRFKTHFRRDRWRPTPKRIWIDQLLNIGLTPVVHVLETCAETLANERETYWTRVFELSPFHILVNGYLERIGSFGADLSQAQAPSAGRKASVVADVGFIIDLTQAYGVWLMKKIAIPAIASRDIEIGESILNYWDSKFRVKQFQIVDAASADLQDPFIVHPPERCNIIGLTNLGEVHLWCTLLGMVSFPSPLVKNDSETARAQA